MTTRCGSIFYAYRTVSELMVFFIAEMDPIDLLAPERKRAYKAIRTAIARVDAKRAPRAGTLGWWQRSWEEDRRERWTSKLLGNLIPWLNREYGEVGYCLNQFLSGHEYYTSYLFRMGKAVTENCGYCGIRSSRARVGRRTGELWRISISADNIVGLMLQGMQQ